MSNSTIFYILSGLLFTVILFWITLRDKQKNLKVLWSPILLLLLTLGFGIFSTLSEGGRAEQDKLEITKSIVDSKDTLRKGHGDLLKDVDSTRTFLSRKIDSLGLGTIRRRITDSHPTPQKSWVNTCADESPNPVIERENDQLLRFKLAICNDGNGLAFNFMEASMIVGIVGNNIFISGKSFPSSINTKYQLRKEVKVILHSRVLVDPTPLLTEGVKIFHCTKLTFSDSVDKYQSLIRIYEITGGPSGKPLYQANSDEYEKIEKFLTAQKIW